MHRPPRTAPTGPSRSVQAWLSGRAHTPSHPRGEPGRPEFPSTTEWRARIVSPEQAERMRVSHGESSTQTGLQAVQLRRILETGSEGGGGDARLCWGA